MLFWSALPPEMPPFLGGVLIIPTYIAIPDIGVSANKLAKLAILAKVYIRTYHKFERILL